MIPTIFEELLTLLSPISMKKETMMREPIGVAERLSVCLWYFVGTSSMEMPK